MYDYRNIVELSFHWSANHFMNLWADYFFIKVSKPQQVSHEVCLDSKQKKLLAINKSKI